MREYKVMLVDDEDEAREAIAACINWEEIGFKVVAEAENGEDALEKAEIYAPDVILTDIQMPFMDGLTFCKKVRALYPDTHIIIFSGYDEFEYAQEAIRLEAEEYILKPIDSEELTSIFMRIRERMDEEFNRRHNVVLLEKFYQDSLPVLKEQLIIGLLEGRVDKEKATDYAKTYGVPYESAFYQVGVLKQDKDSDDSSMNDALMTVSLKQLADERMEATMPYLSVNYLGTVVIVGLLRSTTEHVAFINTLDQICRIYKRQYGIDTVAGVGKIYGNLKDICHSFEEAKEATKYKILLDTNQAIYIADVEPKSSEFALSDDNLIQHLMREIKIGSDDTLTEAVNDIVDYLKKSAVSLQQLRLYFTEIMVELTRLAGAYRIDIAATNGEGIVDMEQFYSLDAMGEHLLMVCKNFSELISKGRQDSTKLLGEKAKSYIQEQLANSELSVDMVCNHLGVGSTYFSSIFKKETGMSFVSYLTDVRMKEAVKLLETTDEKSYVIAGMVGYEEPTYFSYVFKKQYGVSPAKYRQKQTKQ